MAKTFHSFQAFAEHLEKVAFAEARAIQSGLEAASVVLEKASKKEFGVYQDAAGPFDEWHELADSTKKDRLNKGYSENDPLLRSGKLRDSISHTVQGLEAAIGSDSPIMVYQELGTETIPPRPVLGPAAFRNHDRVKKIIGTAAVYGVVGNSVVYTPGALGAEFEHEGLE